MGFTMHIKDGVGFVLHDAGGPLERENQRLRADGRAMAELIRRIMDALGGFEKLPADWKALLERHPSEHGTDSGNDDLGHGDIEPDVLPDPAADAAAGPAPGAPVVQGGERPV